MKIRNKSGTIISHLYNVDAHRCECKAKHQIHDWSHHVHWMLQIYSTKYNICLLLEIVFLMTKSVRYSIQFDVWEHVRCPVLWGACVPVVTASPVISKIQHSVWCMGTCQVCCSVRCMCAYSYCFTCNPPWVRKLFESCACQKTVRQWLWGEYR